MKYNRTLTIPVSTDDHNNNITNSSISNDSNNANNNDDSTNNDDDDNRVPLMRRSSQGLVRQASFCYDDSTIVVTTNSSNDEQHNDLTELCRQQLSFDSRSRPYVAADVRRRSQQHSYRDISTFVQSSHRDITANTANYRMSTTSTTLINATAAPAVTSTTAINASINISANHPSSSHGRTTRNEMAVVSGQTASLSRSFNGSTMVVMPSGREMLIAGHRSSEHNDSDSDIDNDTLPGDHGDATRRRSHPLTETLDSVSLERQCRELWRLRAALFENSTVDSWSNYHQRLSRRIDSGYRSLECPIGVSLDLPPGLPTGQSRGAITGTTLGNTSMLESNSLVDGDDGAGIIVDDGPNNATMESRATVHNVATANTIRNHRQNSLFNAIDVSNENSFVRDGASVHPMMAMHPRCATPTRPISRSSLIASAAQPEQINSHNSNNSNNTTTTSAASQNRCGIFNPFKASRKTPEPDDDTGHASMSRHVTRLCGW